MKLKVCALLTSFWLFWQQFCESGLAYRALVSFLQVTGVIVRKQFGLETFWPAFMRWRETEEGCCILSSSGRFKGAMKDKLLLFLLLLSVQSTKVGFLVSFGGIYDVVFRLMRSRWTVVAKVLKFMAIWSNYWHMVWRESKTTYKFYPHSVRTTVWKSKICCVITGFTFLGIVQT